MVLKEFEITITGGGPYGMRIKGGFEFGLPISVENVSPKSKAESSGVLAGDVVLAINGVDVTKLLHDRAKQLIIDAKENLTLVLTRQSDGAMPIASANFTYKPTAPESRVSALQESTKTASEPPPPPWADSPPMTQPPKPQRVESIPRPTTTFQQPIARPATSFQQPIPRPTTSTQQISKPLYTPASNLLQYPSSMTTVKPTTSNPPPSSEPRTVGNLVTSRDYVKYEPVRPEAAKPIENIAHVKASEDNAGVCNKCMQPIGNENHVRLGDRAWHSNHFNCNVCDRSIASEGFFEEGDKMVCQNCYEDVFAKRCAKCNKSIIGKSVTASGKVYHLECFTCFRCNRLLTGAKHNLHEDNPHCMECISELYSIKCDGCSKPIEPGQKCIGAIGKSYHLGCLHCDICQADISPPAPFKIRDNKPICSSHI